MECSDVTKKIGSAPVPRGRKADEWLVWLIRPQYPNSPEERRTCVAEVCSLMLRCTSRGLTQPNLFPQSWERVTALRCAVLKLVHVFVEVSLWGGYRSTWIVRSMERTWVGSSIELQLLKYRSHELEKGLNHLSIWGPLGGTKSSIEAFD
jgi:hypothetical protein